MTKLKATKKKKPTGHGGPGRGQGRHLKYGEATAMIRVPISLIPSIKKMMNKMVKEKR